MKRSILVAQRGLAALLGFLFGATLWLGLLLVTGAGFMLFGIHTLLGIAWTAIAAGLLCFLVAAVIVMGLRNAP